MAILTMMRHRFYKNDGTPNAGGKVYTYVAGTTTPTSTYTDSGAGTPNTNPIILDAKGEADIWVVGQIKVNVLESDDTQVTGWPVDNIGSGVSNNDATARWAGTATGSANALAIAPSPAISAYAVGQSFIFKAGASNNSGVTTIAISGLSAIAVQVNGAACAGGEILANNFYIGVLDTLTTCQISKIGEPTLAELGAAALAGSTFTGKVTLASGANMASAATLDLDTATGNVVSVTGTVATSAITMTGAGPFVLIAADAWPLTHNTTTLNLNNGGNSYTCAAGDRIIVTKSLSGTIRATIVRQDGNPVNHSTGSFTATGVGFTAGVTASFSYTLVGGVVQLTLAALSGTSNSTSFSCSGVPAALRPSVIRSMWLWGTDNGAGVLVRAAIQTDGTIIFYNGTVSSATSWTASGTKSAQASELSYRL